MISKLQKPRWSLSHVVLGLIAWTVLAASWVAGFFLIDTIEILFLLAPLVTVPLGLHLIEQSIPFKSRIPLFRFGIVFGFIASVLVLVSFFIPAGIKASALCAPWLLFAGLTAVIGIVRAVQSSGHRIEDLCFLAAQLYLPVGAGWLILSRLGATPMGFAEPIVLLTAVHFHFAGFGAPILAGITVRHLMGQPVRDRMARVAAVGITMAPALIAAGFVFSRHLQVLAVYLSATSLAVLAMCMFSLLRDIRRSAARFLLFASASSVLLSMVLAAVYAIGEFQGELFVSIPRMAAIHGTANALGFSLCGLLAWLLEEDVKLE